MGDLPDTVRSICAAGPGQFAVSYDNRAVEMIELSVCPERRPMVTAGDTAITSIAYVPGADVIVFGAEDGSVEFRHRESEVIHRVRDHRAAVTELVTAQNGSRIYSLDRDWNSESGSWTGS